MEGACAYADARLERALTPAGRLIEALPDAMDAGVAQG